MGGASNSHPWLVPNNHHKSCQATATEAVHHKLFISVGILPGKCILLQRLSDMPLCVLINDYTSMQSALTRDYCSVVRCHEVLGIITCFTYICNSSCYFVLFTITWFMFKTVTTAHTATYRKLLHGNLHEKENSVWAQHYSPKLKPFRAGNICRCHAATGVNHRPLASPYYPQRYRHPD